MNINADRSGRSVRQFFAQAVAIVGLLLSGQSQAVPGDFDGTFGVGGKVVANVGVVLDGDFHRGSLRLPDGRLLTFGACSSPERFQMPCVARFLANGALDSGFSSGGVAILDLGPDGGGDFRAAALDGGRIVAAGTCSTGGSIVDICVARMLADGSPDSSFGTAGKVTLPSGFASNYPTAAVVDANGKYVIAGYCGTDLNPQLCVIRLDISGSLDPTFNGTGRLNATLGFAKSYWSDVAIFDGKLVVAGSCTNGTRTSACVARFNDDGSLDTGFGSNGIFVSDRGALSSGTSGLLVDGQKMYVAGGCRDLEAQGDLCIFRLLQDGSSDVSFNGIGAVQTRIPFRDASAIKIALHAGKIVVATYCQDFSGYMDSCWARYNVDGSLDTMLKGKGYVFGYGGGYFSGLSVDATGVLLSGACFLSYGYQTCLRRFDHDGNPDPTFGANGSVTPFLSTTSGHDNANAITRQTDGKLVTAGSCLIGARENGFCIARFLSDGQLDTTFNGTGYVTRALGAIGGVATAVTRDGDKIVVAGICGSAYCVARLNGDGTLDTSFNTTGIATIAIGACPMGLDTFSLDSVRIHAGKILLAGACRGFGSNNYYLPLLVRYLGNGLLDTSFNGGGMLIATSGARALASVPRFGLALDGNKILIAGVDEFQVPTRLMLNRYNDDGSKDLSFGNQGNVTVDTADPFNNPWYGAQTLVVIGGKLVIGGQCQSGQSPGFCLMRLSADGTVDSAFNGSGTNAAAILAGVATINEMTSYGDKLIAAGRCVSGNLKNFCFAVYNPDGSLDTSLAPSGARVLDVAKIETVALSTIIASGHLTFAGTCVGKRSFDICMARVELPAPVFVPGIPAPPLLTSMRAGDSEAFLQFTMSASNGGSPVTGYTVSCMPGSILVAAAGSPVTISGLTNDTAYTCSVTATNAVGSSVPSNAINVTPSVLKLISVVSRMTHGTARTFDLPISTIADISGDVTVEPRYVSTGNLIVFRFNRAFGSEGSWSARDGTGSPFPLSAIKKNGSEIHVTPLRPTEATRIKISLTGIDGVLDVSASMGFLGGDVNDSRVVNPLDTTSVKARAGQVANVSNFMFDLNASGSITAADIAIAKARGGRTLQ